MLLHVFRQSKNDWNKIANSYISKSRLTHEYKRQSHCLHYNAIHSFGTDLSSANMSYFPTYITQQMLCVHSFVLFSLYSFDITNHM